MNKISLGDLTKRTYEHGKRIVAPLVGFPGVNLVNNSIKLAQQNYGEHFKVFEKLVHTFSPDIIFPLMDLSVEANAIGRYTIFPKNDSATVPKDSFSIDEIDRLREIDISKDMRLLGYVKTLGMMSENLPANIVKGAYVTGPYTLAALIMGADNAAMATILENDKLHKLTQLAADKIKQYSELLIDAGADLICILEPTAVMLGPNQFEEFSSNYIKNIIEVCSQRGVSTIYHTCGNTMHLVEKMAESGVNGLSLDSKEVGVELEKVAEKVPENITVIGNISPVGNMLNGTSEDVKRDVFELLTKMDRYPNFILSTGCDLPQETPIKNIHAFMKAGRDFIIN